MSKNILTYLVIALAGVFSVFAMSAEAASENADSPDNAEFLLNSLSEELAQTWPDTSRYSGVYLRSNLPDEQHRRVVDRLLDDGVKLHSSRDNAEVVLEVEIEPVFTLDRFSRRSATRTLALEYSIHYVDRDDVILDNLRNSVAQSDTVSYRNKDDLVTDWAATRFTDINDSSRWRWISAAAEPAVLIGATAVTVILLYNTRSN